MHKPGCTIYVGDLHSLTTDAELYALFSTCGPVSNIKIVRNPNPTALTSACYAYVNYDNPKDAENAISKFNFSVLHNKQMRIMIYDKTRKDYNIIVKNLHSSVDNKTFYDTFSVFGQIASSKVAVDSNNQSKGYGFVSYYSKSAAKKAIALANDTNMKGNMLKVVKHVKNSERQSKKAESLKTFTNVYCKNFDFSEEEIEKIMKSFGSITSFFLPKKEDGSLKGVLFCNFESNECAMKAIETLNGKSLKNIREEFLGEDENKNVVEAIAIEEDGFAEPFYCSRAQSKSEREEELKSLIQKMSIEGQNYKRNLYVTNIPENYSEAEIKTLFTNVGGKITNFSMKKDSNSDKQFCYVCYSTPDEASVAMEKGSDLYLDGNKLGISFFKTKIERQQQRESESFNLNNSFKSSSTSDFSYTRKSNDKKQLGGDLHTLVLSMAGMFQEDWKRMGIKDEYAFADRITKSLLERPNNEVRNMMGLGNVLSQNISDILKDYKHKNSDERK
ncbi:Polyadenylate-binding protein 4 [Gurleya vavrai]